MPSFINEKFLPLKTQKSNTTECACKAVEFGRFVTTVQAGNDKLDMIKTNITANIFKASHVTGEYSFI